MKKQKTKEFLAWILIMTMLISNAAYAGMWTRQDNQWHYQENGVSKTGWYHLGTAWYYFDEIGAMKTGWYQDEKNDRYYFSEKPDASEGMMQTGWIQLDGFWYFLNTVHDGFYGKAITGGWQWIDGYCYLFDGQGKMYADCVTPDGYTVDAEGRWAVDNVVQYSPNKGILTKESGNDSEGDNRNSHSDSSNSGGGNSNSR